MSSAPWTTQWHNCFVLAPAKFTNSSPHPKFVLKLRPNKSGTHYQLTSMLIKTECLIQPLPRRLPALSAQEQEEKTRFFFSSCFWQSGNKCCFHGWAVATMHGWGMASALGALWGGSQECFLQRLFDCWDGLMLFSMRLDWLQEQALASCFLACQVVSSTQLADYSHCFCCRMYDHAVIWPEVLTTGQTDESAALELLLWKGKLKKPPLFYEVLSLGHFVIETEI